MDKLFIFGIEFCRGFCFELRFVLSCDTKEILLVSGVVAEQVSIIVWECLLPITFLVIVVVSSVIMSIIFFSSFNDQVVSVKTIFDYVGLSCTYKWRANIKPQHQLQLE